MRLTLAGKITAAVVGVTGLAVLSSLIALFSSWQLRSLMEHTLTENLPSVRAAEELEISLLEQRGFVSSYVLDGGNRRWLEKLTQRRRGFDRWLARAHETAHTDQEQQVLAALEDVYRQYDAQRDRVVELFDGGDADASRDLFLQDVNQLYDRAYELCESFILANEQYVNAATLRARRQVRQVAWTVGVCVTLTVLLGTALLWLFFHGVLFPLRAMVADARGFTGPGAPEDTGLPTDELRAVGVYLRSLMSDVADTRSVLEDSRSRLVAAEKLAVVGKLAASVAHEIRNPLTSLKMWLFAIQKEVGAGPELDRKFAIVAEETTRLESIVRNFLEFARPPAPKLQAESLGTLLDKTLELVGPRMAGRQIAITRRDAPLLPRVWADVEQLKQVLINLLDNAADAAGEGGGICVRAGVETDAEGRRMAVVRVADNGRGMSDDVRARIFEPFFTTKDEGTGLGLCIAAAVMARHRGRIAVESSTGQGTTFAVSIPTAPAEAT